MGALAIVGSIDDRSADALISAIAELERLGCKEAKDHLIALTSHGDASVRRAAARGLGSLAGPREEAALEVLLPMLRDQVLEVRESVEDTLRVVMGGGDPRQTWARHGQVATAMGVIRNREILEAFLADARPAIREAAAVALAGVADRRSAAALCAACLDTSPNVKVAALDALATIGVGPTDLLSILSDESPRVRAAAARLVGIVHLTVASDALLTMISDNALPFDSDLCSNVAEALGRLQELRAVPRLTKLLARYNASKKFFASVAWALAEIGGDDAREALELALLEQYDTGGLDLQSLKSFRATCMALIKIGDARSVEVLLSALQLGGPSGRVSEIENALEQFPDARARSFVADWKAQQELKWADFHRDLAAKGEVWKREHDLKQAEEKACRERAAATARRNWERELEEEQELRRKTEERDRHIREQLEREARCVHEWRTTYGTSSRESKCVLCGKYEHYY